MNENSIENHEIVETVYTGSFQEKKKTKTRNSSLELLKIIALILIVISHSVPFYGDKNAISYINICNATKDVTVLILGLFRYCGSIGNDLFIICSAYFLLDSKKTKNIKYYNIILDSFCISMIFVLVTVIFNYKLNMKVLVKQFFPLTFESNWFIGCYLLLYAIHPLLNTIINNLNKKQLFRINFVLIFLYCMLQCVLNGKYYYNSLVGFIILYFLVAYMKLYMHNFTQNKKLNFILIILSLIGNLILFIITNSLGLRFHMFSNRLLHWNVIINPMIIIFCISLFNIFNSKNFVNKNINYISSLSLIFYLIHENVLFAEYIRPQFYELVFPYGHILMWVIIEAILLFVCGMILSMLYKETLQKMVYKISNKLYHFLRNLYLKIEEKILLNLN